MIRINHAIYSLFALRAARLTSVSPNTIDLSIYISLAILATRELGPRFLAYVGTTRHTYCCGKSGVEQRLCPNPLDVASLNCWKTPELIPSLDRFSKAPSFATALSHRSDARAGAPTVKKKYLPVLIAGPSTGPCEEGARLKISTSGVET
jgi:hypothetical protein